MGNAQVRHKWVSIVIKQYVFRFQIPVNYAVVVQKIYPSGSPAKIYIPPDTRDLDDRALERRTVRQQYTKQRLHSSTAQLATYSVRRVGGFELISLGADQ